MLQEVACCLALAKSTPTTCSSEGCLYLLTIVFVPRGVFRRVREQLMHCTPEKKTEGLFAGLSKWSKDIADSKAGSGNGAVGVKEQVSVCCWGRSRARQTLYFSSFSFGTAVLYCSCEREYEHEKQNIAR